jgi:hypothetical protein
VELLVTKSRLNAHKEDIMRLTRRIAICLGLLVFGFYIVTATRADAWTKTIKGTATGTAVSANFDFDDPGEGTPAFYVHGEGKGKSGGFSYQALVEVAPDGNQCTVTGRTPNAGSEFKLVTPDARVAVFRYASTGDLLFTKATDATLCADSSGSYSASTTNEITGGTGKFAGASGTVTTTENGAFLTSDASKKRSFGWFHSDIVTCLILP